MPEKPPWPALAVMLAAACLLTAGCHSVPQTAQAAKLDSPGAISEAAPQYWQKHDLPALPPGARIALVEFSVEYVTEKLESPTAGQPRIFGVDYGIYGFVLTSIGVGKKRLDVDRSELAALPNELHDLFVEDLESAGLCVVPDEVVRGAAHYGDFTTRDAGFTGFVQRLSVTGSDTGNVKQIPVYPADGHITVKGVKSGSVEETEMALLEDVGADAVIRARFRVGLYKGHVTIERGSTIRVTTASGSGRLYAVRSIVSDDTIADKGKFKAFRGVVYAPEAGWFRGAAVATFPSYAAMAVVSLCEEPASVAPSSAAPPLPPAR